MKILLPRSQFVQVFEFVCVFQHAMFHDSQNLVDSLFSASFGHIQWKPSKPDPLYTGILSKPDNLSGLNFFLIKPCVKYLLKTGIPLIPKTGHSLDQNWVIPYVIVPL